MIPGGLILTSNPDPREKQDDCNGFGVVPHFPVSFEVPNKGDGICPIITT